MELQAVLHLLESVNRAAALTVQTDSQYVMGIFSEWLPQWKSRGMRTASNKPVKNADLITKIDGLIGQREGGLRFEWVRGHAGHKLNERVDLLARRAAKRQLN